MTPLKLHSGPLWAPFWLKKAMFETAPSFYNVCSLFWTGEAPKTLHPGAPRASGFRFAQGSSQLRGTSIGLAAAFRHLPRTCQESKTSASERRPVNFHLPSSLHGATATVARRPDPNSPNIKMKGRRCLPLGASDKIIRLRKKQGRRNGPKTSPKT